MNIKNTLSMGLLTIFTSINTQTLHEYCVTYFYKKNIPDVAVATESSAYELLKENPISTDINYVAIPWNALYKARKLNIIPSIKVDGGFTVCQSIPSIFKTIAPFIKKMGINTVFTPHASKSGTYNGIKLVPFPHYAVNGVDPAPTKDLLYSFIGCDWTHHTRKTIFAMRHPKNTYIKNNKKWHFEQPAHIQKKNKKEYQAVLARSRFSLCPRGTGPSSIRFWESLQAGAIPLVIADGMVLPEGFDWETAIIRIPEKEATTINEVLKTISLQQEEEMRWNCLKAYKAFSAINLVSNIRRYYDS